MADLKISELGALAGGDLVAADELAIVDDSASETKKITVSNLIANGVTLISDDAIPGAKILFGAGDIATAALADSAVTAAKIGLDAVTGPKIADNVIVNLVSTLPTSGAYTGQLALDTDDNNVYVWNGSAWLSIKAPGSVNAFTNTTAGVINISTAVSGGTATITASIDDTTSAAQFLAGPVGSAGTVGYRTIDGGDLPTATTTSKGGVIVNGGGLTLSTDTIQISNSVSASSVNHLVKYDANGLITAGSTIGSSDLPVATSSAKGAVFIGSGGGLTVNASGNLSVDNTVTSGTYTKVTVTAKGLVSAGATLTDADIPDHSAAKLTSGTISSSRIASDAITAAKLADQSTTKFGGAASSDNVTIFPSGDFQGQFFYDETTQDLYIYTGTAFVPITVLSGNLVNAGAYNANTNQMSSVTSAGSSAGFATGNALPAPAVTNLNHYVVVDTSGTGSGAAPAVALAPPDMLLSQGVGTEYSLIDVSNAIAGQTASNISLIATGDIVATNVQAGITELDQEKLPKAGGTMTGDLNLGTSRNLVFEGSTANDFETTLTVTDPTADRTVTLPNVTGTVVTTGDTGSVTSTMITDGTIVNADINASAEIAVSKLANGTARQLLQTASNGSDVEFTSNVDIPGTLDVTSGATFDSTVAVTGLLSANGKLAYPAGSAAAVSLYSGSDTDTGIYSPGSNQFGISTAGTSRIVVDASGNVGVGDTAPSEKLNVAGNIMLEGGDQYLYLTNAGTSNSGIYIRGRTSVSELRSHSTGIFTWEVTGSEKMRITSAGNVFIGGTTAATADIALNADGSATFAGTVVSGANPNNGADNGCALRGASGVQATGNAAGTYIFRGWQKGSQTTTSSITAAGSASFAGNITSGNPTTGDGVKLYESGYIQLKEDTGAGALVLYQGTADAAGKKVEIKTDGSATFASTVSSGTLLNSSNFAYITPGQLYVNRTNTSSPALIISNSGTQKCTIGADGVVRANGYLNPNANAGSSSGYGSLLGTGTSVNSTKFAVLRIQAQSGAVTSLKAFEVYYGTSLETYIDYAGNAVFQGTVSSSNVSDVRFKENITDARPQLADAVALGSQLKNFDWNDDAPLNDELRAKRFLGLVAQEAEKVCPGLTYTVPRTKQGAELTPEVVVPAVYETRTVPAVLDDKGEVVETETTEQVLVTEEQVTPATYEELDDSYKAINHDILVMKLLGAVAELSAEVEALKAG